MTTSVLLASATAWSPEQLPANVRLGPNSVILRRPGHDPTFQRFLSRRDPALLIGANCTMDGVLFNVGHDGAVSIGDFSYFQEAILLCAEEIRIGSHVFIGWQATLSDADFHPIDPVARQADAIACSPSGLRNKQPRQRYAAQSIVIEDDAYIGPHAVILKGVRIGAGAIIEPGAVIVRDVPPGARMLGNPAREVTAKEYDRSADHYSR
jgi:acetyltransferase-like isoleucine patch superfamily enzyme